MRTASNRLRFVPITLGIYLYVMFEQNNLKVQIIMEGGTTLFRVAGPLITSENRGRTRTVCALNSGVKLSDVNRSIARSAARNRTNRQRSIDRARLQAKY